jgi:beta-N-acetylhexosaminidase
VEDDPGKAGIEGGARRRWPVLGAGAVAVVVLAVLVVALTRDGQQLTTRDRAQLEAAAPGTPADRFPASPAVRRAAATLDLRRQVAQLFAVDRVGVEPGDGFLAEQRRRGWGTVVLGPANFVDQEQFTALTGELAGVAREAGRVLPLTAINQSGGPSSALADLPPRAQPLIGQRGRAALAGSEARATARALTRLGVNMNLAPVADVGTPVGPLQSQVFSDDPEVVTRMVRAAVAGYRRGGVVSAVSHFPGIGAASADPAVATATVGLSLEELRQRDLRPFTAVARRVPVVMVSNAVYAAYDGITPAVLLPGVVGQLLRSQLGFRGVVMTPDLNATAPIVGKSIESTAVAALLAGADLLYVAGDGDAHERAYQAVLSAVRRGQISRQRLRVSVLRILTLKQRYGLLLRARG